MKASIPGVGGGVEDMELAGRGDSPGCIGGEIGDHMVITPHIPVIGNNVNHKVSHLVVICKEVHGALQLWAAIHRPANKQSIN